MCSGVSRNPKRCTIAKPYVLLQNHMYYYKTIICTIAKLYLLLQNHMYYCKTIICTVAKSYVLLQNHNMYYCKTICSIAKLYLLLQNHMYYYKTILHLHNLSHSPTCQPEESSTVYNYTLTESNKGQ